MATRRSVAIRRQNGELDLRKAAQAASVKFAVPFEEPQTPPHKYPDIYAAELIESVTKFIRKVTEVAQVAPPQRIQQPQRRIA